MFWCQARRRLRMPNMSENEPSLTQRQEHGSFHIGCDLQTREKIGLVNEIGCGQRVKEVEGKSLSEILFKRRAGAKIVCNKPE